VASATYAPNFVSIYNASTGSVFSSALTRNGVPDMVFFDISGINGDSFAVALWQNSPDTGPVALSLVTFDVVPEPAAALLGSLGLLGLLRRRRS
jgi:MYXO-CTERM domain-containing protein